MSGSSGFPVPFRTYHHELPATVPEQFLPAVTAGRMSFPDCDGSPIRTDPVQYPSGQFPDEPEHPSFHTVQTSIPENCRYRLPLPECQLPSAVLPVPLPCPERLPYALQPEQ